MRNEGGHGGMAGIAGLGGIAGQGGIAGMGMLRRDNIVKLIRHELNTPLATALLYLGIAEGSAAALPEGSCALCLTGGACGGPAAQDLARHRDRARVCRIRDSSATINQCRGGRSSDRPTTGCRSRRGDSTGGHARRSAGVVGSFDGRADRRQPALECTEVRPRTPDPNRRQTGGVWRSHLRSRSRDRRRRRRSGMDLRAQHARHARGRRRAWPRALARSASSPRPTGDG